MTNYTLKKPWIVFIAFTSIGIVYFAGYGLGHLIHLLF